MPFSILYRIVSPETQLPFAVTGKWDNFQYPLPDRIL
jgi:hypothetical protein